MGVFFYTYLKITIDSLVIGAAPMVERKFLTPFFITFSVIALGFFLMVFILARILSHRVAGPLYAFEKFIDDLLVGKSKTLKLRNGDEFKHLEELAVKLKEKFDPHPLPTATEVVISEDGETVTDVVAETTKPIQ
jgi:signal peptidase II